MPITHDQVRPGVKVRVLRNDCGAYLPDVISGYVPEGGILTLNGTTEDGTKGPMANYDLGNGLHNSIYIEDLELIDPGPVTEPRSRATFVCNLPGNEPGLTDVLAFGLSSSVQPTVVVAADPSWRRVGRNLIGPPLGDSVVAGDVGIYEIDDRCNPNGEELTRHVDPEPAPSDPASGPGGELVVESSHSGPGGEPDDRLSARIDALAASVAMLRVEIAAELAKLRTDVDAVRREMDYGKDDGK